MALTSFQRFMLLNAHPVKLRLNYAGGLAALYFLWQHQGPEAIAVGGGLILLGTALAVLVSPFNAEIIAETTLGRMFLQYATPVGFVFYLVSNSLILVAAWRHDLYLAVGGVLILILGLTDFWSLPVHARKIL